MRRIIIVGGVLVAGLLCFAYAMHISIIVGFMWLAARMAGTHDVHKTIRHAYASPSGGYVAIVEEQQYEGDYAFISSDTISIFLATRAHPDAMTRIYRSEGYVAGPYVKWLGPKRLQINAGSTSVRNDMSFDGVAIHYVR